MKKNSLTLKETFLTAIEEYKKKNFKKAETICYKILSIEPNHFDSILLLATISAMSRDFSNAKELLLKAIELQPKNVSALNNLATSYKELGDIKEAENYYEKVIKICKNLESYIKLEAKSCPSGTFFYEKVVNICKNLEKYIKLEAKSCPSGTKINFFMKK